MYSQRTAAHSRLCHKLYLKNLPKIPRFSLKKLSAKRLFKRKMTPRFGKKKTAENPPIPSADANPSSRRVPKEPDLRLGRSLSPHFESTQTLAEPQSVTDHGSVRSVSSGTKLRRKASLRSLLRSRKSSDHLKTKSEPKPKNKNLVPFEFVDDVSPVSSASGFPNQIPASRALSPRSSLTPEAPFVPSEESPSDNIFAFLNNHGYPSRPSSIAGAETQSKTLGEELEPKTLLTEEDHVGHEEKVIDRKDLSPSHDDESPVNHTELPESLVREHETEEEDISEKNPSHAQLDETLPVLPTAPQPKVKSSSTNPFTSMNTASLSQTADTDPDLPKETLEESKEAPLNDKHSTWSHIFIGGLLLYAFMSLFGFSESQHASQSLSHETLTVTKTLYATPTLMPTPAMSPSLRSSQAVHKDGGKPVHEPSIISAIVLGLLKVLGYAFVPVIKGTSLVAIAGLLVLLIWHHLDVDLAYIREISARFSLHKWFGLVAGIYFLYKSSSIGLPLIAVLAGLWYSGILRVEIPGGNHEPVRQDASVPFKTPPVPFRFPKSEMPLSVSSGTISSREMTPATDVFSASHGSSRNIARPSLAESEVLHSRRHLLDLSIAKGQGHHAVNSARRDTSLTEAPSISSLRAYVAETPS